MTYTVSSGTLNCTIPYHNILPHPHKKEKNNRIITRMCTLWRCKYTLTRKAKFLWITWASGEGSSSCVWHQSKNTYTRGVYVRIHGVYTYVYTPCVHGVYTYVYTWCIRTYTPHVYTPCALDSNVFNPKSVGFSRLLWTTTMPSFKSFRLGFSFHRANMQTHTHCDKTDHNIRAAILHSCHG